MSTTLQSIIEEFYGEDQKFIRRKASVLAEEMIRHADSLAEVSTALAKPAIPRRVRETTLVRKPAAHVASKSKTKKGLRSP